MSELFDPDDERAALELDQRVDEVLAGRSVAAGDVTVPRLVAALRVDPTPRLATKVAADRTRLARRRLAPVRIAAALMAYLFLSHGIGNLVGGDWVARNLGEPHSPHAAAEGGLALVAVGLLVAVAARSPRWLPAAAAAGVPLGLAFGILGVDEVGEFTAGAVLHLSQLGAAVAVGVGCWRGRRYIRALRDD